MIEIDKVDPDSFRGGAGFSRTVYMPTGEYGPANRFLLYLFKVTYQRQFALENGNPENWWYWDLSSPEIAQGLLTIHQERLEEIYTHPGFRSEFTSLVKLWHERMILERTRYKEPEAAPELQTHFDFVTYDEITVAPFSNLMNNICRSIRALRNSLENAFLIRYGQILLV